eukprot:802397_1
MAVRHISHVEPAYLQTWSKRHLSSKRVKEVEIPQWRKLMYNADGTIKNYYEILGIEPTATNSAIKSSYYHLNKLLHPDSRISTDHRLGMDDNKALIKLREAHEAYHVLKSRNRKAEYDSERKRIAYLDNVADVEELVHSDFEKDRELHEKVKEIQYANFKRWRQENHDPHSFIQLTHKQLIFNRKLAQEQEITSKESIDLKVRRQRTLDYKLWKQKVNQKQSAFNNGTTHKVDLNLTERMNAQKSRYKMETLDDDENSTEDIGHIHTTNTANKAHHHHQYKPNQDYDENMSALHADEGNRMEVKRTVDITPGIGDVHMDIVGDISSNPDSHKHHRNATRQRIYEEWKQKQHEDKYKVKSEPLQIVGKVDESAKAYSWYESVGSPYVDGMTSDRSVSSNRNTNKGVGTVKANKSYDAFNFSVNPKDQVHSNVYYDSNFAIDSSKFGNNMIMAHVGVICAALFVFVSWRGAKVQ